MTATVLVQDFGCPPVLSWSWRFTKHVEAKCHPVLSWVLRFVQPIDKDLAPLFTRGLTATRARPGMQQLGLADVARRIETETTLDSVGVPERPLDTEEFLERYGWEREHLDRLVRVFRMLAGWDERLRKREAGQQ